MVLKEKFTEKIHWLARLVKKYVKYQVCNFPPELATVLGTNIILVNTPSPYINPFTHLEFRNELVSLLRRTISK